jgi:hypothetical protein
MKLPAPIKSYFDADQIAGVAPPIAAFAGDARVKDEGKTHVGHAAIETWWRAAKAQYKHRASPREISQAGDLATVRAEVSGDFPGSPAMLTFRFKLAGARIATLEIGA